MSRITFAAIAAPVSLVNAIPAFVVPDALASLYGVILDRQTLLLGQTLAASYLGYAVINWMTRDGSELSSRRGIAAGKLGSWGVGDVLWTSSSASRRRDDRTYGAVGPRMRVLPTGHVAMCALV